MKYSTELEPRFFRLEQYGFGKKFIEAHMKEIIAGLIWLPHVHSPPCLHWSKLDNNWILGHDHGCEASRRLIEMLGVREIVTRNRFWGVENEKRKSARA